jgi:hypothetical protein
MGTAGFRSNTNYVQTWAVCPGCVGKGFFNQIHDGLAGILGRTTEIIHSGAGFTGDRRKTAMDALGQTSGDGSGLHPRQSALRQSMVHIFVGSGDRRRLGGPRQCNYGTVARFYRGRKGNHTLRVVSSFSTLRRFFDLARFCRRGYPYIIAIYALRHGICL